MKRNDGTKTVGISALGGLAERTEKTAYRTQMPVPRRAGSDLHLIAALRPRLRSALERLLAGDSEAEAVAAMGMKRPTFHGYVKELYRIFNVGSRAKLMALWVDRQIIQAVPSPLAMAEQPVRGAEGGSGE